MKRKRHEAQARVRQAIERREPVAAKLGLDVVPLCGRGTLPELVDCVQGGGPLSQWGAFQAEGIVARPATELCCRSGERLICKLKAKDLR